VTYRHVADEVQRSIESGDFRPGDRLPTQRAFAREHGIAVSTASRVYQELIRRGLASGEVGRGTFVRASRQPLDAALQEPQTAPTDLDLNFPLHPEQFALASGVMAELTSTEHLRRHLSPVGPGGTASARAAFSTLGQASWFPEEHQMLFTGSGRQAIAAAVAALVPPGGTVGVEELTYPVLKGIAQRVNIDLVPLGMDEDGVTSAALVDTHRSVGLDAVYLQPTLHNPLGTTMSTGRRREVARTLAELDLPAIEDAVYGFLAEDPPPPLAAFAPDRVVFVDSLSKRFAPGLSVGRLICPADRVSAVTAAVRSGGWIPSRFNLTFAERLIRTGTLAAIEELKRRDAADRQRMVAQELAGQRIRAGRHAYHCWWQLPRPWRADLFIAAAAREGIAVTPGAAFAAAPGVASDCVRLALGSCEFPALADAIRTLAAIASDAPPAHRID
jgi:DNA-binding transcriptional MocR family regulator